MSQSWSRQPNESARWYARFDAYRALGPSRTIETVFQTEAGAAGLPPRRPGQAWYNAARTYNWQRRAEAWDETERTRLAAFEESRRSEGRDDRIHMVTHILTEVFGILCDLDLRNPTPLIARSLPTIRILFKDMLILHRTELGMPAGITTETAALTTLTADDLLAAQQELESFRLSLAEAYPDKLLLDEATL